MNVELAKGANVISLQPERTPTSYAALAQVEGYWDALSHGAMLPSRSDIDPRGLQSALEYAFILERIAPRVARFRIAGSHLNNLMGMEVGGMPATALFLPEARAEIADIIDQTCTEPKIVTLKLRCPSRAGQPAIEARMLLAPVLDDRGEVTRILGCLQSQGRIGQQPRRFLVLDNATRRIGVSPTQMRPSEPVAGFGEAGADYSAAARPEKPQPTHPALRLIVNND